MLLLHTIALVLIFLTVVNAQEIPNKSFEDWSGGDPVNWLTSDVSGFDAVSQSSDAFEGSSPVFMQILDAGTTFVFLPSLQVSDGLGGIGTPVTQRYGSFGGRCPTPSHTRPERRCGCSRQTYRRQCPDRQGCHYCCNLLESHRLARRATNHPRPLNFAQKWKDYWLIGR